MNSIGTKRDIIDVLAGNAYSMDNDYYSILDGEIFGYLDNYNDSINYRYGVYDLNTIDLSNLMYLVLDSIKSYTKDIFRLDLNFNLKIKPIVVFYLIYNIVYIVRKYKNINIIPDYEIEDIVIDAINYSGIVELINDTIAYHTNNHNLFIEELVIPDKLIPSIRTLINDFINSNNGFFNLIRSLDNVTDEIFMLLVNLNILPRYEYFNLSKLNTDIYELVKLDKKYDINVINVRLIIVGAINEKTTI